MSQIVGQKTLNYPEIGDVTYYKKDGVSRISIRISIRQGVRVTLPYYLPYRVAETFFASKQEQIKASVKRLEKETASNPANVLHCPSDSGEIEKMRKEAKGILIPKLEKFAKMYGFTYRKVFIKNNVSNWGSCSSAKNINLNMKLIFLPDHLQQYVILHELCHLTHPNHGKEFHTLLDKLCHGQEKELQKELKSIILK